MWEVESATRRKIAMMARALAVAILGSWHSWIITSLLVCCYTSLFACLCLESYKVGFIWWSPGLSASSVMKINWLHVFHGKSLLSLDKAVRNVSNDLPKNLKVQDGRVPYVSSESSGKRGRAMIHYCRWVKESNVLIATYSLCFQPRLTPCSGHENRVPRTYRYHVRKLNIRIIFIYLHIKKQKPADVFPHLPGHQQ
jgi:hypothetical protein